MFYWEDLNDLLRSGRGPFIPGFRYRLVRNFEMSSAPPAEDEVCILFATRDAASERPTDVCSSAPIKSQSMLVGEHTAVTPVPFFVHFSIPTLESIDFSQDGSFSTTHLGILLFPCCMIRHP
jgi:hypothetical protein